MYFFVVLLIICVGVFIVSEGEKLFKALVTLFIGCFFLLFLNILASPIRTEDYTEKKDIVLMKDGTETEGVFALFGGYVSGNQVFNFYTSDSNGVKRLESVDADEATIVEDAKSPYVLSQCERTKGSSEWFIELIPYDGLCDSYEFHIPEGSISNKIELDGE